MALSATSTHLLNTSRENTKTFKICYSYPHCMTARHIPQRHSHLSLQEQVKTTYCIKTQNWKVSFPTSSNLFGSKLWRRRLWAEGTGLSSSSLAPYSTISSALSVLVEILSLWCQNMFFHHVHRVKQNAVLKRQDLVPITRLWLFLSIPIALTATCENCTFSWFH